MLGASRLAPAPRQPVPWAGAWRWDRLALERRQASEREPARAVGLAAAELRPAGLEDDRVVGMVGHRVVGMVGHRERQLLGRLGSRCRLGLDAGSRGGRAPGAGDGLAPGAADGLVAGVGGGALATGTGLRSTRCATARLPIAPWSRSTASERRQAPRRPPLPDGVPAVARSTSSASRRESLTGSRSCRSIGFSSRLKLRSTMSFAVALHRSCRTPTVLAIRTISSTGRSARTACSRIASGPLVLIDGLADSWLMSPGDLLCADGSDRESAARLAQHRVAIVEATRRMSEPK